MYKLDGRKIGEKLKNLRLEKKLSLRAMEEVMGLYHTHIYKLGNSDSIPTLPILIKYCNEFKIGINELL